MKSLANVLFLLICTCCFVSCSKTDSVPKAAKGSSEELKSPPPTVESTDAKDGPATLESESAEPDVSSVDISKLTLKQQEELAASELQKINSDFAAAAAKLDEEINKLETDEEKTKLFQEKNPEIQYTANLYRLAQKFPSTEAAYTAGMTIVLEFPTHREFPATMDLILENHGARVEWHQIVDGYLELVPAQQIEDWLRKMIDSAGSDVVKVQMTFFLYRYFDQFPTFASTIEYNPEIKARFAKEQIDYIFNRKNQVREELLTLLKDLKENYPDVPAQGNRKVKDVIDGPIFELEHLQVGSQAPDIIGTDFDGVEFRLSDYRGKVVMLDFWGQWCPPCRAMFPHERELIEKLVGKPFVLLGVNSDRRLETAMRATKAQNLVWRNFWCGPQGRTGPIPKKWNVSAWPTVYLIDADGVIRYKEVLGDQIDKGIEQLLTEMGHPVELASRPDKSRSMLAQKNQLSRSIQVGNSK